MKKAKSEWEMFLSMADGDEDRARELYYQAHGEDYPEEEANEAWGRGYGGGDDSDPYIHSPLGYNRRRS